MLRDSLSLQQLRRKMSSSNDPEPGDAAHNLALVKQNIKECCERMGRSEPTLVAVSKTKPSALIQECYDAGHRDFGENYAQELVDKAGELSGDIRWHFIGTLQSNKCKMLLDVPNLDTVETAQSAKHVRALAKAAEGRRTTPLNVYVQVNTSGEESKSGASPSNCVQVVQEVLDNAPALSFRGLMTIGRPDAGPEQPDFHTLLACREDVAANTTLALEDIGLSMGMSSDYIAAIEHGSTNVRVGSTIFGKRNYPKTA
eukprot:TRINITY_DN5263_c0_g1_i1.p1 TRINITY_DN5263_c0_g1~~TRINITY_DN5263_c0_g1_i1.p1  ORF type:complete len:257 (+),score=64.54 TRINITY_DN5263_c0_g1_i1:124-894(+)